VRNRSARGGRRADRTSEVAENLTFLALARDQAPPVIGPADDFRNGTELPKSGPLGASSSEPGLGARGPI